MIITSDFQVHADQTLLVPGGAETQFFTVFGVSQGFLAPHINLDVYGTVIATSQARLALGFSIGPHASLFDQGLFRIHADGVFRLTATDSSGAVIGFGSEGFAPNFTNDGLLEVIGAHDATGVDVGPQGDWWLLTNTGTLRVVADGAATGAALYSGGSLLNAGVIDVSGNETSFGVKISGQGGGLHNTGLIRVTDDTAALDSVAVYWGAGPSAGPIFQNQGTIEGDYALKASGWFQGLTTQVFENSGAMTGLVYFVGMPVELVNTGTITGDVLFGADNDQYVGSSGRLQGDLHAGEGADALSGGSHVDRLFGDGGDDWIRGGGGDDQIDGGAGVDTAVFVALRNDVLVRSYKSGNLILTQVLDQVGGLGSDTLARVETLSFLNDSVGLYGIQQNHLSNMDGHRFDDVVLCNASTGQVGVIDMFGQATATQGVVQLSWSFMPIGWKAVATGDLGGDGRAEVILQSASGGLYHVTMDGTSPTNQGTISANLPAEWKVVGVGDMTLDGTLDVVIRSSATGNIMYAEMDGTPIYTPALVSWGNVVNMGLGWRAVGVGDYDRDGDSDVLVQEIATGTTYFAQMQGGVRAGWGLVTGGPGAQWVAKETADFNGDGCFDVVFQNTATGQIWYVDMAGGVNSGWGTLTTAVGWDVVGTGDYDNDGYADILVQSSANGELYYIDMNNGLMAGWGNVNRGLGPDWVAV